MPFRARARFTVENLSPDEVRGFYYQIDYALTNIPDDRAYFHAQWRRSNPLPYKEVHTLLDRHQRTRALCRNVPRLGREQTTAGGVKGKSSFI